LGVKPNRIDLLTGLSGIGHAALLLNKQSTGGAKDLGDAEELRKRDPKPKQAEGQSAAGYQPALQVSPIPHVLSCLTYEGFLPCPHMWNFPPI
jgi:hypothetical protein